jgi:hypothetical protein
VSTVSGSNEVATVFAAFSNTERRVDLDSQAEGSQLALATSGFNRGMLLVKHSV